MHTRTLLAALALTATSAFALAETPADFLHRYQQEAGSADAQRGRQLYLAKPKGDWSCATCHTEQPTRQGRHAKTDKPIKPLSPVANAERFTDAAKVDKWFRRNCNDVLGRVCTAGEKADLLAYLTTAK